MGAHNRSKVLPDKLKIGVIAILLLLIFVFVTLALLFPPFLHDIVGVANDEFVWLEEAYPTPVLNIYSDSSWDHLREWPQYARNAALLVDPPVAAINLHLPGAGHFSLTDLVLVSPHLVRFLEGEAPNREGVEYLQAVNQACIEFLNHHLK